jgi:transcription elongation factor Elf1
MESKNIKMFGSIIGKTYTCPHCGQRRIRIRFFE